ncbi:MAG: nucleotidyltransferase domain-containing protein [Actinomycetota bacterium]
MGTNYTNKDIASALFGKTRRSILALLFTNPARSYYLREIIRDLGLGRGSVQRELENLVSSGLVERHIRGNQVHFRANTASPVFDELKMIMLKTAGLAEFLGEALEKLGDRVLVAFIYGSAARGDLKADSDVDLFIIGSASFRAVVAALARAQDALGREVNPSTFTREEFRSRVSSGEHFVNEVLQGAKIFVIGDAYELEKLASQRLADRTQNKPG